MQTTNVNQTVVIECDDCGEVVVEKDILSQDAFRAAWEMRKSEGWIARKLETYWFHACPKHAKNLDADVRARIRDARQAARKGLGS